MSVAYTIRCLTCDSPIRASVRDGVQIAYCPQCSHWTVYGEDEEARCAETVRCIRRHTEWPYWELSEDDYRSRGPVRIEALRDCGHCRHSVWGCDRDPEARRGHVRYTCRLGHETARGQDMPCWEAFRWRSSST